MSSAEGKKTGVLRGILVVIGSVVLGSLVMFAVQSANYVLFPPPAGLDYNDPKQLQQIVDAMPLAALWMLELSYALGCLVEGVVTAVGARGRRLTLALIVGGIFTVLGFVNLTQFPAPLWLAVVTTVTYVPATLAGSLAFSRLLSKPGA
jgi:hypothetical protein